MKPEKHLRKKKTAEKSSTPEKSPLKISPARLWLFRICAAIFIPLILLGALELGLRIFNYGYPTDFFLRIKIDGKDFYVPNNRFGFTFFPREIARTPAPQRMPVKKSPDTFRIFVFGESAAMGDPDPSFGAWRYLQTLLRDRFPGENFEVVNVSMTAINSNVLLPIARECDRRDGDLWIIYMGNNEMVGPFGGGTVFGSRAPDTTLIRANITLKKTKIGQWLADLLQRKSSAPKSWQGLAAFEKQQLRFDDANRLRAYDNFQKNLNDILRAGCDANVPIILSTVASNLKDCAPFASLHPANFSDEQKSQWEKIYQNGIVLENAGEFSGALKQFLQAEQLDSHFAELHFRIGACDLALTNFFSAANEFRLARDDDTLVFRADSRINQIIANAGNNFAGKNVHLLDAEKLFAENSPQKISGNDFFYEHVHLNFDGNFLLGRALAEQTAKLLPPSIAARGKTNWATQEFCDAKLAASDYDRLRIWQDIAGRISVPPYTSQITHEALAHWCEEKISELQSRADAETNSIRQLYENAVAQSPDDGFILWDFAEFLGANGDLAGATKAAARVCELLPQEPGQFYDVGNLLILQGRIDDASNYFSRALAVQSDFVNALNGAGLILQNEQKTNEALGYFHRALRAEPDRAETCINIGFLAQQTGDAKRTAEFFQRAAELQPDGAADKLNQGTAAAALGFHEKAIEAFESAVQLKPDFWQAHFLLGEEFAAVGNISGARAEFLEAARRRPDFAPAHLNLGVMLAAQKDFPRALKQFQIVLEIEPDNVSAKKFIGAIQKNGNGSPP